MLSPTGRLVKTPSPAAPATSSDIDPVPEPSTANSSTTRVRDQDIHGFLPVFLFSRGSGASTHSVLVSPSTGTCEGLHQRKGHGQRTTANPMQPSHHQSGSTRDASADGRRKGCDTQTRRCGKKTPGSGQKRPASVSVLSFVALRQPLHDQRDRIWSRVSCAGKAEQRGGTA
jgi:hypothetical protein